MVGFCRQRLRASDELIVADRRAIGEAQAALANEIPLTQLRPLACLRAAKAFARDIIGALLGSGPKAWAKVAADLGDAFMQLAREKKTSRSRTRIPLEMGAAGA